VDVSGHRGLQKLTDRSFSGCQQNFLRHIILVITKSWNSSASLRGTLGCAISQDSNQERERTFIISVFAEIDQTYSYGRTPNCIPNLFLGIYFHYFILADECIVWKDFYFGGIDQNCRFTWLLLFSRLNTWSPWPYTRILIGIDVPCRIRSLSPRTKRCQVLAGPSKNFQNLRKEHSTISMYKLFCTKKEHMKNVVPWRKKVRLQPQIRLLCNT
jgi:hypothetical protein